MCCYISLSIDGESSQTEIHVASGFAERTLLRGRTGVSSHEGLSGRNRGQVRVLGCTSMGL
jgi:hypothetical protein